MSELNQNPSSRNLTAVKMCKKKNPALLKGQTDIAFDNSTPTGNCIESIHTGTKSFKVFPIFGAVIRNRREGASPFGGVVLLILLLALLLVLLILRFAWRRIRIFIQIFNYQSPFERWDWLCPQIIPRKRAEKRVRPQRNQVVWCSRLTRSKTYFRIDCLLFSWS